MNREDTIALLKLRLELTGHNFGAGMLDTWAELLGAVDRGEAVVAMRRACTKKRDVQWPDFHAELAEHQHAKKNAHDERLYDDCPDCGGCGWREAPDLIRHSIRYTMSEPCTHRHAAPLIGWDEGGREAFLVGLETELIRQGKLSREIEMILARY